MIIYNVTIKIDWSIAEDWLEWMQSEYVPNMLATGCFEKHQLLRLLEVDELDGPTYAAQYYTSTLSNYDNFLQHYAQNFKNNLRDKWGEKYFDFSTIMQVV